MFSVPMPPFTLQMFHVGDGLVVEKNAGGALELRHPIVETCNVQAMITTGAGYQSVGKLTEHGDFVFSEDSMSMTEHAAFERDAGQPAGTEVFLPIASFWTPVPSKGWRQCGCAAIDVHALLEHACDGTPMEFSGELFIPHEKQATTTVALRITSSASAQERTNISGWLQKNPRIVSTLQHNVVSKVQVRKQLKMDRCNRELKISGKLNGIYGNVNVESSLGLNPKLDTMRDTSGYAISADPTQTMELLKRLNRNEDMIRKNAVFNVTTQLLAVAEECAAEKPLGLNGEQQITTAQLLAFAQWHNKPDSDLTAAEMTRKWNTHTKLVDRLQNVLTLVGNGNWPYTNDEGFELTGCNLVVSKAVEEKMDLTGGAPFIHFHITQALYLENAEKLQRLQKELTSVELGVGAATQSDAWHEKKAAINALLGQQIQLTRSQLYGERDCEDGAFSMAEQLAVSQEFPEQLFQVVKPFISTTLLPAHKMYQDAATGTQQISDRSEELRQLVQLSLRFVSAALKRQAEAVDGKQVTYSPCLCLASAPSLDAHAASAAGSAPRITRELCSSYGDYVKKLFPQQLGGHCVLCKVELHGIVRDGDITTSIATIPITGVCESTTCNTRVAEEERARAKLLSNKSIQITTDGVSSRLENVPHGKARAALGHALQKKLGEIFQKEMTFGFPMDMADGINFYNVVSSIGNQQCISAESSRSQKTSTLNARATVDAIRGRSLSTTFCGSTIAWNACPQSNITTSAVIAVDLEPEAKLRLAQIAHELTTVHAMTKDQLTFFMTQMGHQVSLGFEGGTFHATDYTGGRLDSDVRLGFAFTAHTTRFADGLPEYSDEKIGRRDVVLRKLQDVFPGSHFRVNEVETGSYLVQMVVNM